MTCEDLGLGRLPPFLVEERLAGLSVLDWAVDAEALCEVWVNRLARFTVARAILSDLLRVELPLLVPCGSLALRTSGEVRSFCHTGDKEDVRERTHERVHRAVFLRQVDAVHEVPGVYLDASVHYGRV